MAWRRIVAACWSRPFLHHLTIRNRRCVASGVSITPALSSWICSPPRFSNILVPLPKSTGTSVFSGAQHLTSRAIGYLISPLGMMSRSPNVPPPDMVPT